MFCFCVLVCHSHFDLFYVLLLFFCIIPSFFPARKLRDSGKTKTCRVQTFLLSKLIYKNSSICILIVYCTDFVSFFPFFVAWFTPKRSLHILRPSRQPGGGDDVTLKRRPRQRPSRPLRCQTGTQPRPSRSSLTWLGRSRTRSRPSRSRRRSESPTGSWRSRTWPRRHRAAWPWRPACGFLSGSRPSWAWSDEKPVKEREREEKKISIINDGRNQR